MLTQNYHTQLRQVVVWKIKVNYVENARKTLTNDVTHISCLAAFTF